MPKERSFIIRELQNIINTVSEEEMQRYNDAGETVLIMKPSHGGDANGSLNIALTKDTSYTIEDGALANGAELEIFYVLNEKNEAVRY